MKKSDSTAAHLFNLLSNIPRWVEVRDVLRSGEAVVLGDVTPGSVNVVVRDRTGESAFVIGAPSKADIQAAAQALRVGGAIIAAPDVAPWVAAALPAWRRDTIWLHTLPDSTTLPVVAPGAVQFVDVTRLDAYGIPNDLLGELQSAAEYTQIAGAMVADRPVAFCYAASETETWWDIAVDTLPEARRQGHAGRVVAFMVAHMAPKGKAPVWAALDSNPASWRLAAKLGFVKMDEMALFERQAGQ